MDRRTVIIATIIAAATAASIAVGVVVQQAFTKTDVQTIASAKRGSESRVVALSGTIKNHRPEDNVFALEDASGTAQLFTCPRWYKKIEIKDGQKVNVTGHIMSQKPDAPGAIYVLAVHTMNLPDGKHVLLRSTLGKPPWAEGLHIRSDK